MSGDDLKGPGQHRRNDPITSRLAALRVDRENSRGRVLTAIFHEAGTADELEDRLGIETGSLTPRLGELKRLGLIETNGNKRLSKKGSPQHVYSITAKGFFRVARWNKT